MANKHGVVITTHCAAWNVDAFNYAGIATTDLDNGTFVALGDLQKTEGVIDEYTFTVTPDTNGASKYKYIVASPVVGTTLAMQLTGDPREFCNEANRPLSVKRVVEGDCIEVIGANFEDGSAPTDKPTATAATIGANGKLAMADDGTFKLLGTKTIAIGQELVPSYVLQYIA